MTVGPVCVYWRISPEHLPHSVDVMCVSDAEKIKDGLVGSGYLVSIVIRRQDKEARL